MLKNTTNREFYGVYSVRPIQPHYITSFIQWQKKVICNNVSFGNFQEEKLHGFLYDSTQECRAIVNDMGSTAIYKSHIYNEQDLIQEMHVNLRGPVTHETMFVTGFKRQGDDFFKDVNGAWLFANYNEQNKIFTLANGLEDTNPLFYWEKDGVIVFSSSLKRLLAFPGISKDVDEQQIGAILNSLSKVKHSTCFKYIKRLPPGHVLTFSESGVQITQYWTLADIPQINFKKDADYTQCFLELYTTAVKQRLSKHGKTGISLSGGLDSGTVAILAAEELAKHNEQLYTYTSVPLYQSSAFLPQSRFGDERPYIDLLCKKYNNIDSTYLDSREISPIDGIIASLDITCQPMHAAGNMFWLHNVRERAMADGVDTLFLGRHGNMTVSFGGIGNHSRGIIDFIKNYRYFCQYFKGDLMNGMAKLFIPEMVFNRLRGFYPSQRKQIGGRENGSHFSAINPTFAEKLKIVNIEQKSTRNRPLQHIMFENSFRGVGADYSGRMEAEYGLKTVDPTFDKKVVEFCFGIPDEQFYRYGMRRFLIRRAFCQKMPQEIIWNKKRGRQAADVSLRIRYEYSRVEAILNRFTKSSMVREMLDINKMSGILKRTRIEENRLVAARTNAVLLRGLMVGLFLLKQEGDLNRY